MSVLSRRGFLKACAAAAMVALVPTELTAVIGRPLPTANLAALDVEDFSELYIRPAMEALARAIDDDIMRMFQGAT